MTAIDPDFLLPAGYVLLLDKADEHAHAREPIHNVPTFRREEDRGPFIHRVASEQRALGAVVDRQRVRRVARHMQDRDAGEPLRAVERRGNGTEMRSPLRDGIARGRYFHCLAERVLCEVGRDELPATRTRDDRASNGVAELVDGQDVVVVTVRAGDDVLAGPARVEYVPWAKVRLRIGLEELAKACQLRAAILGSLRTRFNLTTTRHLNIKVTHFRSAAGVNEQKHAQFREYLEIKEWLLVVNVVLDNLEGRGSQACRGEACRRRSHVRREGKREIQHDRVQPVGFNGWAGFSLLGLENIAGHNRRTCLQWPIEIGASPTRICRS